jgi:uncharacterized membrane protein
MRAWLIWLSDQSIVLIDAVALLAVLAGTAQVILRAALAVFHPLSNHDARAIWIRYARWLVGALTFQLAADIIETAITTSWEAVGRVGVIALIRTFLNYFLDRDLEVARASNRLPTPAGREAPTPAEPRPDPDRPSPRD